MSKKKQDLGPHKLPSSSLVRFVKIKSLVKKLLNWLNCGYEFAPAAGPAERPSVEQNQDAVVQAGVQSVAMPHTFPPPSRRIHRRVVARQGSCGFLRYGTAGPIPISSSGEFHARQGLPLSSMVVASTLLMLVGHVSNGAAEHSSSSQQDPSIPSAQHVAPAAATVRRLLRSHESAWYGHTCKPATQEKALQWDCSDMAAPSAEFCENSLFGGDQRCCYDKYGIWAGIGSCRQCQRDEQNCENAKEICTRR